MRRRRNQEWAKLAPDNMRRLAFEQPDATPGLRRRAADAVRALRALGFTNASIRRLAGKLCQLASIADAMNQWPTAGAERASLVAIRDQAASLRLALEGLYPKAAMYLAGGTYDLFNDELLTDSMETALAKLEHAAQYAIERMPHQGRPPNHTMFVYAVLREAEKLAEPMRPSATPSSRFHRACQAAFDMVGVRREVKGQWVPVVPTAAIRAALGNRRPPK